MPLSLDDQGSLVVTVLGAGFRVRIDDGTLILTSPNDKGLVYLAAD